MDDSDSSDYYDDIEAHIILKPKINNDWKGGGK